MTKAAMIWGAGGGIGRAIVNRLREEGWHVLAIGRHTAGLGDLTPDLIEADVADPASVERAIAAASRPGQAVVAGRGHCRQRRALRLHPGDAQHPRLEGPGRHGGRRVLQQRGVIHKERQGCHARVLPPLRA
ncbi:MAG: SDR family NAD(P)-dependent oxidoreductase, partial [Anaerolineae bacterium]|nr:SDR family NAD(P)-dependent oxidoreductase [Anaerolineae bacterium]